MADGLGRWRDAALGAVFQAQDSTVAVIVVVRDAGRGVGAGAAGRLDGLAGRGAVERERATAGLLAQARRARTAVESAVLAVATSELAGRVVDAQLNRVLRPVVETVLTVLEQEPDRIQPLVRGQRDTMVDELVGRIRSGAAAGDGAVDRMTGRMLRRGSQPVPAPPADLR
jgi:hypothetical protein